MADIRHIVLNDKFRFDGLQIASKLGYKEPGAAVEALCDSAEKVYYEVPTMDDEEPAEDYLQFISLEDAMLLVSDSGIAYGSPEYVRWNHLITRGLVGAVIDGQVRFDVW